MQSLTLIIPLPPRSDISTRLHGWQKMGELVQKVDAETGHQAIFVGQGPPLAALVGYYGKIPPHRTAEAHAGGNFRVWWQNRELEPGADVVYVDEDKHSEAANFAGNFAEVASNSISVSYAGRHIRNFNVTIMKNLQTNFKFK